MIKRTFYVSPKRDLILSKFLTEVIWGMMLGDAYASRANLNGNVRIQFHHSLKQAFFIDHLYGLFKEFCGTLPVHKYREDLRINRTKEVHTIMFKTLTLPCFNIFQETFYVNGVKCINPIIGSYLTNVSLAYWIMCDSYFHSNGVMICTESFSLENQLVLCHIFKTKFDIDCSPNKYGQKYRLFIRKSSMEKLIQSVKPYMLEPFLYKLEL